MNEMSFLQRGAWGAFQKSLGRKVVGNEKWLGVIESAKGIKRLYLPYGPFCKTELNFAKLNAEIIKVAKDEQCDFVRIEPTGKITEKTLETLGYQKSPLHIQPEDTMINDISNGVDIPAKTSQKVRRYSRKAEAAGVSYSYSYSYSYEPSDIKYFIEMIHEVAARTGMKPHADSYFEKIAENLFPTHDGGMLFAEIDGKKIASVIFYQTENTLIYAHAANLTEYRNLSPATGLGLYMLNWAQENGKKWVDWYGVAPEGADKSHPWSGFTEFKESYGGERVKYVGTWEFPINKIKYKAYRALIKLR